MVDEGGIFIDIYHGQWRQAYNSLLERDQEIQMPKLAFVRMALACLASFQFYHAIPVQGVVMIILGFMQSHRSCQFAVRFKDNFVLEAPLLLMQLSLDSFLKRVSPRMSQTQRVYVRGLLRESVLWASFIHQGGLNVLTYRGERQTQREDSYPNPRRESPRKKLCTDTMCCLEDEPKNLGQGLCGEPVRFSSSVPAPAPAPASVRIFPWLCVMIYGEIRCLMFG